MTIGLVGIYDVEAYVILSFVSGMSVYYVKFAIRNRVILFLSLGSLIMLVLGFLGIYICLKEK